MSRCAVSRALALTIVYSLLSQAFTPTLVSAQACGAEVVLVYLDAGTTSPRLWTPRGAPVVGGDFAFRVQGGTPNELGFLIFNGFENPTFDPTFQATIYPQLPAVVRLFGTNPLGSSPLIFLTSEIDAELCGVQATFQAGVTDSFAPGGFALTNAVRLRVGSVTEPLFEPGPEPLGSPIDVAFGDMDGDALRDWVASHTNGSSSLGLLRVKEGLQSGGFGSPTTTSMGSGASSPSSVELADISGDGDLDAVVGGNNVTVVYGDGAGGFFAALSYAAGAGPHATAIADLDLDGFLDVVAANAGGSHASVLLGTGSGILTFPSNYLAHTIPSSGQADVELADLDQDGDLDMVLTLPLSNVVSFLFGNGFGGFAPPITMAMSGRPTSLVLEDLDGDTLLDLAVACVLSNDVAVSLGNGNGTFGSVTRFAVGDSPLDLAFGDFDGDLEIDLVSANGESQVLSVMLGNGDGTFTTAESVGLFTFPRTLATVDSNLDGALDIVVSSSPTSSVGIGNSATLLGHGDGTFRSPRSYGLGHTLGGVSIGDLDDDGWNDLVAVGFEEDQVFVLLSNQDGTFGSPMAMPAGNNPWRVVIADLDGDFIDDLLVHTGSNPWLPLMLRGNGDGTFEAAVDAVSIACGWLAVGDLDGDSVLDLVAVTSGVSGIVSSFLGNGDGTFGAPANFSVPTFPGQMRLADLDGDTFLDMVVPGLPPVVLLGNGDGTFGSAANLPISSTDYIALGDFVEDGKIDLISAKGNAVRLYTGVGNGTFGAGVLIASGVHFQHVVAGDLNDDGNLDVVVLDDDAFITLLPGNGNGTFGPAMRYPNGLGDGQFALGDLDGDGVLDIAAANEEPFGPGETVGIWVLLNRIGE